MSGIKKAMKKLSKQRKSGKKQRIGLSEKAIEALNAMTVIDDMIDEQEGIDYNEEKRESKSGKDDNSGNKIRVDEYKKQKLNQQILHLCVLLGPCLCVACFIHICSQRIFIHLASSVFFQFKLILIVCSTSATYFFTIRCYSLLTST